MQKTKILIFFILLISYSLICNHLILAKDIDLITYPAEDEVIYLDNPKIGIYFKSKFKDEIDFESLKIYLNEVDITAKGRLNYQSFVCFPLKKLPQGKNSVKITGFYKNKEVFSHQWYFYIKPENLIKSISHTGHNKLIEGEKLTVTLYGIPTGVAYFNIDDWKTHLMMKEISPGIYQGNYKVKRQDLALNKFITVFLKKGLGIESSLKSSKPVNVVGQLFMVKILTPASGEKVNQRFKIKGRTRPNSIVKISNNIIIEKGLGIFDFTAQTGGIETKSDKDGFFEIDFGFPSAKLKGAKFILKFVARDEYENYSIPAVITLFAKD